MSWLVLALVALLYIAFARAVFQFWPGPRKRSPADRFLGGSLPRDDDRCWLAGGLFYDNPDDPAPVVPNRYFLGWTVNLGHPAARWAVVLVVGLLWLPVALAIAYNLPSAGCHTFGCVPR